MKKSALVILSGGQDSTTCLWWAKQNFDEVHTLSFDYGQRHHRELEAATLVSRLAEATSHTRMVVGNILGGRSPLTNKGEELEQYENFEQMDGVIGERIEKTFVPMRNALFLTIAANFAICMNVLDMVTGVCQADNANYPDCRAEFIRSQEITINMALGLSTSRGLGDRMEIHTPLMNLSKAQSIRKLQDIGADAFYSLAFTHTAYDGQYPPTGKDHATILRAYGFEEAGVPDPLVIRANMEGLMELPTTPNYSNEGTNNLARDNVRRLLLKLGQ